MWMNGSGRRLMRSMTLWWLAAVLAFIAGCGGAPAEETDPIEAVVEQVLSSPTPTPSPTGSPTSTPTPVPPTVPPTPTPVPPTETPFPPTPTATPPPLISINDPTGDAVDCGTLAAIDDPEVDLSLIQVFGLDNGLYTTVKLDVPLESDYSFAVLLALQTGRVLSAYIWEVHDTDNRIGQMDPQTGNLLEAPPGLEIFHDFDLGEIQFTLPVTRQETVTTTTQSQVGQMFISSFHTPSAGAAKNCDSAGPFTFQYPGE